MAFETKAPPELLTMIEQVHYKEGWYFSHLRTHTDVDYLRISIQCEDSTGKYQREVEMMSWMRQEQTFGIGQDHTRFSTEAQPFGVTHTILIPPVDYFMGHINVMRRWLMDQVIAIETHEACEFFKLPGKVEGTYYVPFFPHDGDDNRSVYKVIDKTPAYMDVT